MAQDIVVRYRAEVDDLLNKLDQISDAQKEIIQGEVKANEEARKATTTQEFAAKKRAQLLELEKKRLAELQAAQKLAFDPKQIEAYNKKIAESNKNIELLSKNTKNQASIAGGALRSFATGAATAIAAAFSVDAVIQFGKASVNAFLEAERNAERLRFAITTIGGESEAAFERLIRQSSQLKEITVFDGNSIQAAQAALSAFGLTANEIERTIPLLADFATVTGVDLPSAAQQLGAGLEGAGREFKKYGIEVSATASRQQNLNALLDGFTRFAGSAEAATETLSGRLQQANNRVADLQESLGQRLAPIFIRVREVLLEATLGLLGFNRALEEANQQEQSQLERTFENIAQRAERAGRDVNQVLGELVTNANQKLDELGRRNEEISTKIAERLQIISASARENFNPENDPIIRSLREQSVQIDQVIAKENKVIEAINAVIAARQKQNKVVEEGNKLTDERVPGSAEEVKQITTLTAAYRDLLALQQLTAEQRQVFELALSTGDIEQFKIELAKLSAENKVEIPVELTIPDDRLDLQIAEPAERAKEQIELSFTDLLSQTQTILNEVQSLYNDYTNAQIEQINRVRDAQLESLDIQLQANEDALERRQISEVDAEENRRRLLRQREEAEATAARKERELRKKQAQANKAAAIAQATINIAEAVTKALTAGPVAGQILAALTAALGAVQLGIIASQPIPYKRGSKNTKGGLSRVGEEGEEILYIPQGAKVLPNKQTNRYGEVLDAMFDNRFDDFIQHKYIAPALMKEKSNRAIADRASFAENIIKSASVNGGATGLDYFGMRNALKKGTAINNISPEAADTIARALSKYINTNPYRN